MPVIYCFLLFTGTCRLPHSPKEDNIGFMYEHFLPAISVPSEGLLDKWKASEWISYILKLFYSKTVGLLHADPHPLVNPLDSKHDAIVIRGRPSEQMQNSFRDLYINDNLHTTQSNILHAIREKSKCVVSADLQTCAQTLLRPKLLHNLKIFYPRLTKHFSSCVLKSEGNDDGGNSLGQTFSVSFSVYPEGRREGLSFCPFGEHKRRKFRKVLFYLHVGIGGEGRDELWCSLKYTCFSCSRGTPPKSIPILKFSVP